MHIDRMRIQLRLLLPGNCFLHRIRRANHADILLLGLEKIVVLNLLDASARLGLAGLDVRYATKSNFRPQVLRLHHLNRPFGSSSSCSIKGGYQVDMLVAWLDEIVCLRVLLARALRSQLHGQLGC